MEFKPNFEVRVAGISKNKSNYMENYQKYIDEFCTPPQYKKKKEEKPKSINYEVLFLDVI